VLDATKRCGNCHEVKSEIEFRKNRTKANSLDSWCRVCKRAYTKQWRQDNPAKQQRSNRRVNLRRYGLIPEDYDRMVEAQRNRCGICGTDRCGGRGSLGYWHIDHDPKTGRVRGLLCFWCNTRIGILQKFRDKGIWDRAVAWIESDIDLRPHGTLFD
jgi:hypothetical protein